MSLPINAALVFQVPTSPPGSKEDGLGNLVPTTKDYRVEASIRRSGGSYSRGGDYSQGEPLNEGSFTIAGRSINPKLLPIAKLPRECRCTITDPVIGNKISGTLVLDPPVQSKFQAVTNALGTKISGQFTEDRGWV